MTTEIIDSGLRKRCEELFERMFGMMSLALEEQQLGAEVHVGLEKEECVRTLMDFVKWERESATRGKEE